MTVTYYVALPFIQTDEGVVPGKAEEFSSELSAVRRAEVLAGMSVHSGAVAFKRSGQPGTGEFGDAEVLKSFGEVHEKLDEL
jgi:hypothetical protein